MCSVRSTSGIRAISMLPAIPAPPNRQSVTPVACSENIEKFTPAPSPVAPNGYGVPGKISNLGFDILKVTLMASRNDSGNRCDFNTQSRYYRDGLPMRIVDFYFDFSSTNSYFAAFLLPEICARIDARVNWMPTHFAALFRGTGFDVMAMTPRKARYLWRDHARYAELTGLPFRKPSRFPIKTSSSLRAVLAAGETARADD